MLSVCPFDQFQVLYLVIFCPRSPHLVTLVWNTASVLMPVNPQPHLLDLHSITAVCLSTIKVSNTCVLLCSSHLHRESLSKTSAIIVLHVLLGVGIGSLVPCLPCLSPLVAGQEQCLARSKWQLKITRCSHTYQQFSFIPACVLYNSYYMFKLHFEMCLCFGTM